jgi:hypothetical protein
MKTPALRLACALAMSTLLFAATAPAATITIVNGNAAGIGFNDPTVVAPIGGNTGTTRGQQRLIAFQFAADVWGALLPSDVEIKVSATFEPLTCTASSAVLGSAGPRQVFSNFANAPLASTWYVAAEANKLAGVDLAPGSPGTTADDLQARFNVSIDDNENCLAGTNWYYGLDGNNSTDIDLVVVLLHEFAHGLGFISLMNSSTGALLSGVDDVYTNFLYDNNYGLHWPGMAAADRAFSAISPQKVGFDGPYTKTAADALLGYALEALAIAPSSVAGSYAVGEASFGPSVADVPVSGNVVLAIDNLAPTGDACSALLNAAALNGNIAMVDRGTCAFTVKVQAAQDAGAIGVIVVNNAAGPATSLGGTSTTITIPAVMISQADGNLLKTELANGLYVSLGVSNTRRAGMDTAGRPLIYTPSPLQSGSSVSHFDISASPNLLMEPAINNDLSHNSVDLTLALFRDLGWFLGTATPVPGAASPTVLQQNAPNPFNPSTTIRFTLAEAGDTELRVFNVRGQHVRHLVAGSLTAGDHSVVWDGRNDGGAPVPSGIYFYKLTSGAFEGLQRMVLLK